MGCNRFSVLVFCGFCSLSLGCTPLEADPKPGPDKQGAGLLTGALAGAGSGAVTGAQLAAGAGPGAWVGAGFGALYGLVTGMGDDAIEEEQYERLERTKKLRERTWAQNILTQHYQRRLALHPNRDIYPADLFFCGDSSKLSNHGEVLARELALVTKERTPWSRILVASYISSAPTESNTYADSVMEDRAEELALRFVKAGIDARRVQIKGVRVAEPVVLDPLDSPGRYRQAIEIITLDN